MRSVIRIAVLLQFNARSAERSFAYRAVPLLAIIATVVIKSSSVDHPFCSACRYICRGGTLSGTGMSTVKVHQLAISPPIYPSASIYSILTKPYCFLGA